MEEIEERYRRFRSQNADDVLNKIREKVCDHRPHVVYEDDRDLMTIEGKDGLIDLENLQLWIKKYTSSSLPGPPHYKPYELLVLIHRLVHTDQDGDKYFYMRRIPSSEQYEVVTQIIQDIRNLVCTEWIGPTSPSRDELQSDIMHLILNTSIFDEGYENSELVERVELANRNPPLNEEILEVIRDLVTCMIRLPAVTNDLGIRDRWNIDYLVPMENQNHLFVADLEEKEGSRVQQWRPQGTNPRIGELRWRDEEPQGRERSVWGSKPPPKFKKGEALKYFGSRKNDLFTHPEEERYAALYTPPSEGHDLKGQSFLDKFRGYVKAKSDFEEKIPNISKGGKQCITPCEYRPDPILTSFGASEDDIPSVCICYTAKDDWDYCEDERCIWRDLAGGEIDQ